MPPASINWDLNVKYWPMYGNADWGDCVFAMIGHAIQVLTANAGTEVRVSDDDVLKGYSDVTGFNKNAGPPGNNPTDQGTVIQDALNYWRKTGVGGHKILAFAEVDHTSETQMQQAAALFGVVLLGISFPASAGKQFDAGVPWDVAAYDGGIEGGHAILGARYDQAKKQWYWITWGKEQPTTFAFISKYLEEAWVVASQEWVDATGSSPSGLDLAALNAAFTQLTGEPGPFQTETNPPQPPEPPVVPPLPTALDVAVQGLLSDGEVATWVKGRHVGTTKHVAQVVAKIFGAAGQS
jgi:hypothetical protein